MATFGRRLNAALRHYMGFEVVARQDSAQQMWEGLLGREGMAEADREWLDHCLLLKRESRAQLFQDVLALQLTGFKQDGFFVEFGAADGVYLSNSYLLEKSFGWKGILAEPGRVWQDRLIANRDCVIDFRCVDATGAASVAFVEAKDPELSTTARLVASDHHADARRGGEMYEVETVTLSQLLGESNCPSKFDYLSIDTEGSEFEILQSLDFGRYRPQVVTVEHNFTAAKRRIHELMTTNGYRQVLERFSKWDSWYVDARTSDDS